MSQGKKKVAGLSAVLILGAFTVATGLAYAAGAFGWGVMKPAKERSRFRSSVREGSVRYGRTGSRYFMGGRSLRGGGLRSGK
jgi:hypothetical protein